MVTPAVRNLVREGKTHQLYSVMQSGGQFGMQTMDASLAELVKQRRRRPTRWPRSVATPRRVRPPGRRRMADTDGQIEEA